MELGACPKIDPRQYYGWVQEWVRGWDWGQGGDLGTGMGEGHGQAQGQGGSETERPLESPTRLYQTLLSFLDTCGKFVYIWSRVPKKVILPPTGPWIHPPIKVSGEGWSCVIVCSRITCTGERQRVLSEADGSKAEDSLLCQGGSHSRVQLHFYRCRCLMGTA